MAERSRMTLLAPPTSDISDAAPVSRALPAPTIHGPASERTTPSPPAFLVTEGAVFTRRSGQAEMALISRGPDEVEAGSSVSPGQGIRAKTNQVRIGDPVTGTQIREQSESNLCADRRRGLQDFRFVVRRLPSRPAHEAGRCSSGG